MASTQIYRTSGTPTLNTKFTLSYWFKKGAQTTDSKMFASYKNDDNFGYIRLAGSTDKLQIFDLYSASATVNWLTTRVFRDPSAWYHVVIAGDSTESVQADRMKLYINGTQVTDFTKTTNPALDTPWGICLASAADKLTIGSGATADEDYDGCYSHFQYVDGSALAPTEFGEVDGTSGIWKIKTGCYATPGNNGFCLKMENRTNLDLDSSSNAHTFTTTGNLTATYDNPSNNFCTMNPLDNYHYGSTFSNGNLKLVTGGSGKETYNSATMGVSAGLWYYEVKINTASSGDNIGYQSAVSTAYNDKMSDTTNGKKGFVYKGTGGSVSVLGVGTTSGYATYTGGDVIGVYLDLTANKIYVAKDGVIGNSGTGLDATAIASVPGGVYYPCVGDDESNSLTCEVNFGNGYFGTTAVTSAVADEGGIGAFEYDPSDGGASSFDSAAKDFRAICTKNIKAYGG